MDGMTGYIEKNQQRKTDPASGQSDMKGKSTGFFGAKAYKISRDAAGNRLTHLKVTSGRLKVKDILKGGYAEERSLR